MNFLMDSDLLFLDAGIPATIKELHKADKPVTVLFDLLSLAEAGILTDKPQATLKESDLTGTDIKAATITVSSIEYQMIKPLPDGAGLVIVGLKRV